MNNQLKPRLDLLLEVLKNDFALIAKKKKDDEWKRDHFRYTFTVHVQRIYEMLTHRLQRTYRQKLKSLQKKKWFC